MWPENADRRIRRFHRDGADFMRHAQRVAIASVAFHAVIESRGRVEAGAEGEPAVPHHPFRRQQTRANRADIRRREAAQHFV
jgi:hypothetical protein